MRNLIIIIAIFIFILCVKNSFAQVVYVTNWKSDADKIVYVTSWKSDADMIVYVTSWKSDAKPNSGIWFFTEWKSDADWKIYFTNWKSDANLIIYFTEWKSDADGRIDYTIYRTKDKRRCKMLISTPYFFILKFKIQMELHLNKYAEFN